MSSAPYPPVRSRQNSHPALLSRRAFLTLLGLGVGSSAALAGTVSAGYLLLAQESTATPPPAPPTRTPDPTLQARLKTAQRPPIVARASWGARDVNNLALDEFGFYTLDNPEGWREYEGDLRVAYQTVIIHHSSLYDTDDDTTIRAIQDLHMDDRNWADIGYHFCVGITGTVYEGRRMSARGTHTELHNTGSLGICLFGNFQRILPTEVQIRATQALVNWLALRLRLSHLAGHRDFNSNTVCPGENLYPYLDGMAAAAQLQRGTGGYIAPPEQLTLTPSPPAAWLSPVDEHADKCCT